MSEYSIWPYSQSFFDLPAEIGAELIKLMATNVPWRTHHLRKISEATRGFANAHGANVE